MTEFDDIIGGFDEEWMEGLTGKAEELGEVKTEGVRIGIEGIADQFISEETYQMVKRNLSIGFLRVLLSSAEFPDPVGKKEALRQLILDCHNISSPIYPVSNDASVRQAASDRLIEDFDDIIAQSFNLGLKRAQDIRDMENPDTITDKRMKKIVDDLHSKQRESSVSAHNNQAKISRIRLI